MADDKGFPGELRRALHAAFQEFAKLMLRGREACAGKAVLVCDGQRIVGCVPSPETNVLLIRHCLIIIGYPDAQATEMARQAFKNSPVKYQIDKAILASMEQRGQKVTMEDAEGDDDTSDTPPIPLQ